MKPRDSKDTLEEGIDAAIALGLTESVARHGSAAAEFVKAYTGVDNEVGKNLSKGLKGINLEKTGVKHRAGWAAEVASTSRENAEAIISRSAERTIRSDDLKHYGIETDPRYREAVDRVRVDKDSNVIYEAQTKLEANGNKVANQVSHEDHKYNKYFGKKLELPSEQADDAKRYCRARATNLRKHALKADQNGKPELAEKFRERAERFDQLAEHDIVDLGLSTQEAIAYAERPLQETIKDIARTSHRAGLEGAKYGAVIGGTISVLQNVLSVAQGEREIGDAAIAVATDTAKAGLLGYGTGFVGAALKGAMQQSGSETLRNLSKTNAPALAVNICLSLGSSIKSFVTGEITESQLLTEIGEKGSGMLASSMMAAVGQVVIPIPFVGAAIGGMVGYTLSSLFYQSALEATRGAELSSLQLERTRSIQAAARERIAFEQAALDDFTRREMPQLRRETERLFAKINTVGDAGADDLASSINHFATLLGKNLLFQSRQEFDDFMDTGGPLVL
jgi:hypothetical protein